MFGVAVEALALPALDGNRPQHGPRGASVRPTTGGAPLQVLPVYLILLDISGYTRFATAHEINILHAELIIGDLLESVINRSKHPLAVHELLGDAVTFFVQGRADPKIAQEIRRQIAGIFEAFRVREGVLVSDCRLCACEACRSVGKLRLKAIVHFGQAVFTKVGGFQKIAGPDVILAHRLLKNSIPAEEYVLETDAFVAVAGSSQSRGLERRTEVYEDIGAVAVHLSYPSPPTAGRTPPHRPKIAAVWMNLRGGAHVLGSRLGRRRPTFRNLPPLDAAL